jgi:glycine oxidase
MPPSVIVVGGGIIGCATAYDLAKAGCRVTLFERATPGAEASSAAAGLLAPVGDSRCSGHFQKLALDSWGRYPDIARELRDVTGVDVEHMTTGSLYPIFGREELAGAQEQTRFPLSKEMGMRVVEGTELRDMEPWLSPEISAALFVRGDHWVNNQRLVTAYATAAAGRGVLIRTGVEVTQLTAEGGRVTGVVAVGERVAAESVLLAAGAWSGPLAATLGLNLPVVPVRGQMMAVSNVPPLLRHAVHGHQGYLTPRPSGELLIGATVEHVGFERAMTPEGLAHLVNGAIAVVPELRRRPVTRTWCGFRPGTPDDMPVLGPWPGVEGLYVATGHYRNGILLAPATAALMTQVILGGGVSDLIKPFLPDRLPNVSDPFLDRRSHAHPR